MRIDGQNPLLSAAALAALLAKDEAFDTQKPLPDSAPEPARAASPSAGTVIPQPATSVAMLVTLAAIDEPAQRRRRAVAQAGRGLDALERLRDELAAGAPSAARLRELAEWTTAFKLPEDPALADLAREIELRVQVELAKHDRTV